MGSERKAPGVTHKKQDGSKASNKPARKAEVPKTEAATGRTGIKLPFLNKLDHTSILLGAVLLLAFIIRMLPLTYSINGSHVIFAEFDPYYHMRRIMYTVVHFPFVNSFDSYVNYPHGYGISWPPLFDLISAGASLVAGLGHPSQFTTELVSATVPVVMALFSIVALYYIVKDAINKNAALIASFFLAILPAFSYISIFGYAGHHVLEVLGSLTMYLLFMRSVTSARSEGSSLHDLLKHRKPLIYAILAGIAIAAMIFSWDGAPIYIGVIVAYAFVQYTYDAFKKQSSEYLTIAGIVTSVAALAVTAPFILACPAGQQFTISGLYLSWFHIIYLIGIVLFFLIMGGLTKIYGERKAPWFSAALTVAIGVIVLVVTARFAVPQFFNAIEGGFQFLTGQGDVNVTISEMEGLFYNNGRFSFDVPWIYLSYAGILAVLGLAAYLYTMKWKELRNIEIFLLVWTLIVIILGLLQKRFIYLLAVNVALFSGFLIFKVLDLAGFYRLYGVKRSAHAKEAGITPPIVAVAMISVLLIVGILLSPMTFSTSPEWYSVDWNNACQWVNDHTPKTSDVYSADAGTHPEYGIMSWWDYGNYILYRAERPAVANNFQTGVSDAANFFLAQNESKADAIMDSLSARYVMLDYRLGSPDLGVPYGVFNNMPYLAGQDTNSYYISYYMPEPYSTKQVVDGSDKYYDSMYSRLFNGDGLGGKDPLGINVSGLGHYRLLYQTQGDDPVKVFEYVKGATITGTGSPGEKIGLRLNLTTQAGDETYYSSTIADANGSYSFTVPYPTSGLTGLVATGPEYTITSAASSIGVQVSADAVNNGGTVAAGGKL